MRGSQHFSANNAGLIGRAGGFRTRLMSDLFNGFLFDQHFAADRAMFAFGDPFVVAGSGERGIGHDRVRDLFGFFLFGQNIAAKRAFAAGGKSGRRTGRGNGGNFYRYVIEVFAVRKGFGTDGAAFAGLVVDGCVVAIGGGL